MPGFEPRDFELLYPGVFTERERAAAERYIADNLAISRRGPIDPRSLAAGALPPDTPGLLAAVPVVEDMVRYNNRKYDPDNRLLHDADYARSLGYEDILAMPCFGAHDDSFMFPYPAEARDTLCVSQLNHSVTNYRPVYPGDTLFMIADERSVTDLTPTEGSTYRSLVLRTVGSVFNQRGEKINDCIWRVMESMRVFKPGRRPADFGAEDVWDAPEWIRRPSHHYSDRDWDFIREVWAKERPRGAEPLHWEDVSVGDEPTWTADGPLDDTVIPTAPFGMGTGGSRTLKREIMDPDLRKRLVRSDADGVYRTVDRDVYVPPVPAHTGTPVAVPAFEADGAIDTRDIHRARAGARAPLINFYGRDIALRHVNNWIGDHGWVHNISWGLMPARTMAAYGKPVPTNPDAVRFLDRVPGMRDRYAEAHGLTRDLALVKSYVCDKYVRDGEFFAELAWWIEAITGEIWLEGAATVKLPSRRTR